MISLLIIGLLIVSMVIAKSKPKAAGILDLSVAALILLFRVIPGTADVLDWIFMIIFFLGGLAFCFHRKERAAES